MIVWRIAPVDTRARRGRPFHPLYVPAPSGRHRLDNTDLYSVLYASGEPAGAVAEAFASFSRWGDFLLDHPRGARRRLIALDVPNDFAVLDLDDARALVRRRLRPSQVVTRDRAVTQAWARRVWEEAEWAGVRWWSYHDPRWTTIGLWATGGISVAGLEELSATHPAVLEAGEVMLRTWS